jgi:hypothetical protein
VRGLQNPPHGIHLRSRLDGELDLEPHTLSTGCALQNRPRPPEVRDDFPPRILQRNFQVSRAPRELGQKSKRHPRDEVHEGGRRTAVPTEVRAFVAH